MKTEINTEITWSPAPPLGVARQTHKFSIIDVLEDLSAVLRTDPSEDVEYVIVSWPIRAIIETLPQFIKQCGNNGLREKTNRGIYLGDIADRKFYLNIDEKFTGFELHNSKNWVHCEVCDAREGKKVVEVQDDH